MVNIINKLKKKGQEEMIGFALIVVIVIVILVIFLGISLRNPQTEEVKSYEVQGFIQSFLQYSSECKDSFGFLDVDDLIVECDRGNTCLDGQSACNVLESTLTGIVEESWKIGPDKPIKGYELTIGDEFGEIYELAAGEITGSSKGSSQPLGKRGITVTFNVYY